MIPFTQVLKKKVRVPIPSFKSNSMTDDEKEALEAGVTVRDYDENEKIVSTQTYPEDLEQKEEDIDLTKPISIDDLQKYL